ncbi:hypothetical protein ACJ73_05249 [Blastomyces percursus]|uniref:Uncharacterized protein n=1 Tax=Blastomyces percursus TaxID=1658174 RepID=A0A1J9Q407_9EURO|nr:hypothetical protein ACJ73_05249 [Blastomyces percursus]
MSPQNILFIPFCQVQFADSQCRCVHDDPTLLKRDSMMADMTQFSIMVNSGQPIRVYKYKAVSSLTSGTLSHVRKLDGGDVDVFVLEVHWGSCVNPFTGDGDSGSLGVLRNKGQRLSRPLSMHCGYKGTTNYALSPWSFCEEVADALDADLFFCDVNEVWGGFILPAGEEESKKEGISWWFEEVSIRLDYPVDR